MTPPPQPPVPEETENSMAAAAQKVKSVFSSHQKPSVRIVRGSSAGLPCHESRTQNFTEKPLPPHPGENTIASRLAGARSRIFGHHEIEHAHEKPSRQDYYDQDRVDLMDVVDPEVATLSTLTNVQNSLFLPSLGKLVNRRATYKISESPEEERRYDKLKAMLKKLPFRRSKSTQDTFTYAVLPDDEKLEGWSKEDKAEMDDMVRHQLHSKRAKFKRSMKGFKQYIRRPMGLFITIYATLVTLFGAAWVFFLIGWISLGSKQDDVIEAVDLVLVALFAIIGDGLAPFRAVDTYHMIYIAHYHRISWKRRQERGLPDLADHNDLPDHRVEDVSNAQVDVESQLARKMPSSMAKRIAPHLSKKYAEKMVIRHRANDPTFEYSVLDVNEQAKLDHHERKFSKSHTFYKPHETETHYAFPLKLLVTVVVLLDLHSCLQISLGACTWGIPHDKRPFALTTVILCFSLTANITAGILISKGDKRTRKTDVIERLMRQELTADAIESIQHRQMKDAEERGEIDPAIRKRIEKEKEDKENEEIKKSWKSVPSLPKKLLGKGEDTRQPSLPQEQRRSGSNVALMDKGSSSSGGKKGKNASKAGSGSGVLGAVKDDARPVAPLPEVKKGEDPLKPSIGHKALEFFRKADLDRS
ncbi:hypothetical protein WAI453_000598 [Rhynchosporium graminicola]|uniref:Related to ahmp1 protein n=1 Tax=Rhynchosporium graminicola TaxID=2792576 RepID=A0A1E1JRA8_9HELO|nr:related to ahmp1 protein [Rhynchosporium commune]